MKRTRVRGSGIPADVRAAVIARDEWTCQRCGVYVGSIRSSVHHRKPRRMGGRHGDAAEAINDMAGLTLLCGSGTSGCHGAVESDRAQSYADGWLVYESENPAQVPCLTYKRPAWLYPGTTWTEEKP